MLEMALAAEGLKVRVLHPSRAGLLVRQALHVLEQMQPSHQPCRQAPATLVLLIIHAKRIIKTIPVNQRCQLDQLVFGIEDCPQRASEKIAIRRF